MRIVREFRALQQRQRSGSQSLFFNLQLQSYSVLQEPMQRQPLNLRAHFNAQPQYFSQILRSRKHSHLAASHSPS